MIGTTQAFLEVNNYTKHLNEFENLFLSHPNFPSIYAITDTFNILEIENVAARVPKEQILELPPVFLAHFNNELVLVKKNIDFIYIEKEKKEKLKLTYEEFLKYWDGIVIAIEANIEIKHKTMSYPKNKNICFAISVLLISFIQFQKLSLLNFLNFELYLIGFIISVFIIDEKTNQNEGLTSKICSLSKNISCKSVIKSNNTTITKWLDFSDLPIIFFGFATLATILNPNVLINLNILCLLSLPIAVYSIWLQKIKIKKWCVLCLAVSVILITQTLFISHIFPININYETLIIALTLTLTFWLNLKPKIYKVYNLEKNNKELIKFKRNYNVFSFLQKPLISEFKLNWLSKIEFGNQNSLNTLTLILSPSCGHCHSAFKDAIQLINSHPAKIKLRVFFNLNSENKENPYLSVVENLLQINKYHPEKIIDAISDWHLEKMALEKWLKKWKQKNIEDWVGSEILSQYNWCLENGFNYTPVKIINSKILPKEYSIDEVKYFLTELEEETNPIALV
jgi:uncharacterized membrane protein